MNNKEKANLVQDYIKQHNLSDVCLLRKNLFGRWKVRMYRDCMHQYSVEMPIDEFIDKIHNAEKDIVTINDRKYEAKKTLANITTGNGISSYLKYKNIQDAD